MQPCQFSDDWCHHQTLGFLDNRMAYMAPGMLASDGVARSCPVPLFCDRQSNCCLVQEVARIGALCCWHLFLVG